MSSNLVKLVEEEVASRCAEKDKKRRARMVTMTMEEISGGFWRGRGYVTVPEMKSVLPKGFTHMEGLNGLKRDIEFWGGEKWLR